MPGMLESLCLGLSLLFPTRQGTCSLGLPWHSGGGKALLTIFKGKFTVVASKLLASLGGLFSGQLVAELTLQSILHSSLGKLDFLPALPSQPQGSVEKLLASPPGLDHG